MDALKSQLLRIQQQVSALSASQKMLTTALVAIMVMTLFWWGNYAGTSEMEALLDRPFTGDELAEIKSNLRAHNVTFKVVGDRIMVPADRRVEIIADLGYARKLPRDMGNAFDEVIAKLNPLQNPGTTDRMMNHGREQALAQIISRWPGVMSADVMIDTTSIRRIGAPSVVPTALVSLMLKPTADVDANIGTAAAEMVVGAQAGLSLSQVKVTINGVGVRVRDRNAGPMGDSNDLLEARERAEESFRQKILQQFPYITGLTAVVTVELDNKSVTENVRVVDPKNKVELLKRSTTETEESRQPSGDGVDPGLTPNTGADIDRAPGGVAATMNREKTTVENETDHGSRESVTQIAAGTQKVVGAAIRVPRSYFVKVWKLSNKDAKSDPTAAEVDALVSAELPKIRADVKNATNIADDGHISVAPYDDITQPIAADTQTAGMSVPLAASGISVKEIAIGVLAAVSLFMVSMMVRRSTPPPVVLPKPAVRSERAALRSGEDIAGEASFGALVLQGQELTPEMMESTQVAEQVSSMVKENPEAAANLVKRWLNQD